MLGLELIIFAMLSEGISWFLPNGWIGLYPVLYCSFDTPEGLIMMEETYEKNFAPLVSGKVILSKCKRHLIKFAF